MILYKQNIADGKIIRDSRTMKVSIDERPVRPSPKYQTTKDRDKYIKTIEMTIRKSLEYRAYIDFLKNNLDMDRCIVLKNIKAKSAGKRYHIEIHHEPFTLYDIVSTVLNKRDMLGENCGSLKIADEVMGLHYDGKVGLIPLSVTMHELVHSGRIFIPLQYIYQDYTGFATEYETYMESTLIDKIEAKADLSLKCPEGSIVSDSLQVEFVNLEVDGFEFPQIPDEWKDALMPESFSEQGEVS